MSESVVRIRHVMVFRGKDRLESSDPASRARARGGNQVFHPLFLTLKHNTGARMGPCDRPTATL